MCSFRVQWRDLPTGFGTAGGDARGAIPFVSRQSAWHERLCWRAYTPLRADWDHDHCEFCGRKLSTQPGDTNEGDSTENAHHWICKDCFADYREQFEWTVVECGS
jgi:hypothetical protein